MESNSRPREPLQIKKYPNRRYYDASRSLHVTLQDVYNLILAGHDVVVTDSRSGEDITNLVLAQIILEKDQPKLHMFPSSIFHQMIRANHHVMRSYVDRFFGPFVQAFASTQRQFEAYMRQAMGGSVVTPFEWASRMMSAFTPGGAPSRGTASPDEMPPMDEPHADEPSMDEPLVEMQRRALVGRVPPDVKRMSRRLVVQRQAMRRSDLAPNDAAGDYDASQASLKALQDQITELKRRIETFDPAPNGTNDPPPSTGVR